MKYIKKYNEKFFHLDNPNFDKIVDILERDCKPFLDEVTSNNLGIIFRGARPHTDEEVDNLDLYKKTVRTDRKALDSNAYVMKVFDDVFEKKFGVRPRSSGVFTSKSFYNVSAYGIRYIFIPIGEYSYYWNPKSIDLFTKIRFNNWYKEFSKSDTIKAPEPHKPGIIRRFYNFITNNNLESEVYSSMQKLVNGYKSNDLNKNTNQEIMFICKQYYLLDAGWLEQYKQYIEKR
jgi:hypothetical protein